MCLLFGERGYSGQFTLTFKMSDTECAAISIVILRIFICVFLYAVYVSHNRYEFYLLSLKFPQYPVRQTLNICIQRKHSGPGLSIFMSDGGPWAQKHVALLIQIIKSYVQRQYI